MRRPPPRGLHLFTDDDTARLSLSLSLAHFADIGTFKDGRPHGDGVAEYPGGVRYQGNWAGGWYDGYGKMEYSNGIDCA